MAAAGPLRILTLADIRFPLERANGIQTFETCRALAEHGHTVTLLVRPDSRRPERDPWRFYGAPPHPGLHVRRVARMPSALRRVGYLAAAVSRTLSGAHDVVLTRDLGVASALLRLPSGWRPPVVYESHGDAPSFSRELPALLGRTAHPSRRKLARLERRERRVWRLADGYVTLTALHQAELAQRFGSRARTRVVPDGARPSPSPGSVAAPAEATLVGYAGHLYPWKGVDVLLEALARLPEVRGLVVGGQPEEADRQRLEQLSAQLGIADRVTFSGWLPPADVARHLARCAVLVVPNVRTRISERYTSPLKVFEYMAAGRPIVASNLPALTEVLRDGKNAVLVQPGDPDALAAAVAGLLADPLRGERIARQALADAAQYTWEARASRLEPLLRAVAGVPS